MLIERTPSAQQREMTSPVILDEPFLKSNMAKKSSPEEGSAKIRDKLLDKLSEQDIGALSREDKDEIRLYGRIPRGLIVEERPEGVSFWDRAIVKNLNASETSKTVFEKFNEKYGLDYDVATQDGRLFFSKKNESKWRPLDADTADWKLIQEKGGMRRLLNELPEELSDHVLPVVEAAAISGFLSWALPAAGALGISGTVLQRLSPRVSGAMAEGFLNGVAEGFNQWAAQSIGWKDKISWDDIKTAGGLSGFLSMMLPRPLAKTATENYVNSVNETQIANMVKDAATKVDPHMDSLRSSRIKSPEIAQAVQKKYDELITGDPYLIKTEKDLAQSLTHGPLTAQEQRLMLNVPYARSPKDAVDIYRQNNYNKLMDQVDSGRRGLVQVLAQGVTRNVVPGVSGFFFGGVQPDVMRRLIENPDKIKAIVDNTDSYFDDLAKNMLESSAIIKAGAGDSLMEQIMAAQGPVDFGRVISYLDSKVAHYETLQRANMNSNASGALADQLKDIKEIQKQITQRVGKDGKVIEQDILDPLYGIRTGQQAKVNVSSTMVPYEAWTKLKDLEEFINFKKLGTGTSKFQEEEAKKLYALINAAIDENNPHLKNFRFNAQKAMQEDEYVQSLLSEQNRLNRSQTSQTVLAGDNPYAYEGEGILKSAEYLDSALGQTGLPKSFVNQIKDGYVAKVSKDPALSRDRGGPYALAGAMSAAGKMSMPSVLPGSGSAFFTLGVILGKIGMRPDRAAKFLSVGPKVESGVRNLADKNPLKTILDIAEYSPSEKFYTPMTSGVAPRAATMENMSRDQGYPEDQTALRNEGFINSVMY